MSLHRVIAIDGPAASGKSTVSRRLARELGLAYVNSGSLYRALTWRLLERRVDLNENSAIAAAAAAIEFQCDLTDGVARFVLDHENSEAHLRDALVNAAVSRVSKVAAVREILVAQLRRYGEVQDLVMEGRDIGSIVFPETPFKFYLDASPAVRAQRRAAQGEQDEILVRDLADLSRSTAPLAIAPDAVVIDTSTISLAEVVEEIRRQLRRKEFTFSSPK